MEAGGQLVSLELHRRHVVADVVLGRLRQFEDVCFVVAEGRKDSELGVELAGVDVGLALLAEAVLLEGGSLVTGAGDVLLVVSAVDQQSVRLKLASLLCEGSHKILGLLSFLEGFRCSEADVGQVEGLVEHGIDLVNVALADLSQHPAHDVGLCD